jgi:hypothetical protein
MSLLTHNEGGIVDNGDDSTREGLVTNGFLYRIITASALNTNHMQALGSDMPLPGPPPSI